LGKSFERPGPKSVSRRAGEVAAGLGTAQATAFRPVRQDKIDSGEPARMSASEPALLRAAEAE
jgi:hypothetical protein